MNAPHREPMDSTSNPGLDEAINRIAQARGKTPEEIIAEADQRIQEGMAWDRTNCLLPDDLVEYQTRGTLRPELEAHLLQCQSCTRLLRAAAPDPDRIRAFREEVRAVAKLRAGMQPVLRPAWMDWRAATVMATAVIVVLLVNTRSPENITVAKAEPQIQITARPLHNDAKAAPVTVRLHLPPTSITVTDTAVQFAASTAALAENPPSLNLPLYSSSGQSSDSVHQQATEKAVTFVAGLLSELPSDSKQRPDTTISRGELLQLADRLAKEQGVSINPIGSEATGKVRLFFTVRNQGISTEFDLPKTVTAAKHYQGIIGQKWGKASSTAVPARLELNKDIQLEFSKTPTTVRK